MKKMTLLLVSNLTISLLSIHAQNGEPASDQQKAIVSLIDKYSLARENKDTSLLTNILTIDVDQLVSTGEWRSGIATAVHGMLKSSENTPGTRTLKVDKIRTLNPTTAIVDCRYEIQNADTTTRNMWSTFVVIAENKTWKISAIRNMLPAPQ